MFQNSLNNPSNKLLNHLIEVQEADLDFEQGNRNREESRILSFVNNC